MANYDEWPPRTNYPPPAISTRWQNELNKVAGFAPNGLPHLRLEWGSTCTWTPYVRELKYQHHRQTRQVGWGVDIFNDAGEKIKTQRYGPKDTVPPPDKYHGVAFPISVQEEIGIPRFWISQYIPPQLIGPWNEVRNRLQYRVSNTIDIGAFPREGFYYLGFHLIAHHEGHKCCEQARATRHKCFGYYREPSNLDILYCSELWQAMEREVKNYDWTEASDERTMRKILDNLNDKHRKQEEKEREEMRARIKDAFMEHKGKFTSRKGRNKFYLPENPIIVKGR